MIQRTTFFCLGIAVILPASAQSGSEGQDRITASPNQAQQHQAQQNGPAPGIEKKRVDAAKQPAMDRAFVYQNHLKLYRNLDPYLRCGTVPPTNSPFERRSLIHKVHEEVLQSGLVHRSALNIIKSKVNDDTRARNVSGN